MLRNNLGFFRTAVESLICRRAGRACEGLDRSLAVLPFRSTERTGSKEATR